jgi:uncharacterized protein YceH (UPF0502 family)
MTATFNSSTLPPETPPNPVKILSKKQRRVLGVLVEKGITTPEYYPMTLKGLTAGCNQKNNRSPLSDYSEDDIAATIDELREMGLAAVVHTESGRTERFRHYVRKQFPFNEAQLAIMTELWLRGRQSLGDLRVRASRMHAIDSLEQLRDELTALDRQGFVRANGPLAVRGVDVDHTFYKPSENVTLAPLATAESESESAIAERSGVYRRSDSVPMESRGGTMASGSGSTTTDARVRALESAVEELRTQNADLKNHLQSTEQTVSELCESMQSLRRELGCG